MTPSRRYHGWTVLFNEPFLSRYRELSARARELKETLPPGAYSRHPDVKVFLAVRNVVSDIVPNNPLDPRYLLSGQLARFRRVKGHGLPTRYRLFFVFSTEAKAVIFLYLNDGSSLRQEGGRRDPYALFSTLMESGDIGSDFETNYAIWRSHQPR